MDDFGDFLTLGSPRSPAAPARGPSGTRFRYSPEFHQNLWNLVILVDFMEFSENEQIS